MHAMCSPVGASRLCNVLVIASVNTIGGVGARGSVELEMVKLTVSLEMQTETA